MSGATLEGFDTVRLNDLLAQAETALAEIVDPVTGDKLQPDFSSSDPAMQIVKVPLDLLGLAWEMAGIVADQYNPNAALGPSLHGIGMLNNVKPQESSRSFTAVTLAGTVAAVIPAGTLVTDQGNTNRWRLRAAVTLNGSGAGSGIVDAVDVGPVSAAPGTLTRIVNPTPGLFSITNAGAATLGRFAESDEEFRRRRERSTSAPGFGPVEALRANLANIPGVTYVKVYQNLTLSTDGRGITARRVAPVIVGGDDLAIANVLLQRVGTGADYFGATTKTLYDTMGEPYVMRWTRPAALPMFVEFETHIDDSGTFPANGLQLIREQIVKYAQGGARAIGIQNGFDTGGFTAGALIELTQLYTPINSVPGHAVVPGSLKIGITGGTEAAANYQVPWNQYPVFIADATHIDITPV